MAKVKIQGHASGTGILTITAPNTSTDRTITLPDATGTLLNSDGDGSSLTGIQSPLVEGTDYLAPDGDGSSLTGITTDTTTIENNIAMLAFFRASDNSVSKYNLIDQTVDEYVDATGIDDANSINGVLTSDSYYGGSDTNPTGGTETSYSSGGTTYNVSTFTANGNYVVPAGASTIQSLLVGGGGGGGKGTYGTGGGAGGAVLYRTGYNPGATTYAITIGVGGSGDNTSNGDDGGATTFNSFSATGGGGGGGEEAPDFRIGSTGANGGGSGYSRSGGTGSAPTASGWSVYAGYNGGSGFNGGAHGGGGGGGATQNGQAGTSTDGGDGGNGKQISIANTNHYWGAGGGGGTGGSSGTAGNGGQGGAGGGAAHTGTSGAGSGNALNTGGNGTTGDGYGSGGHAGANTGSGGGGEMGDGADGIAIFVSAYSPPTGGSDLTLQSVATTAQSVPTTGDIIMLIEDAFGTATTNTDVKAYISRDGSAFTSAVTLTDEGNWGTNKRILAAHDVDISGITSGTSMKYKITTHNQSAGSKETKIHATSLAWA